MNAFTIKDLENLSGIKAHTIRIWEQRYDFLKPRRTSGNIRYYSNDEMKTVLDVVLLNKFGYKISQIGRMGQGEVKAKILSLADETAVRERLINDLLQEMIDLNMERFERIITGYIAANGIEKAVSELIFPFLEKTGIIWEAGHILPAQEHLVTNIIRQKLIVAIESTVSRVMIDRTFLLFLPEGEQHELGLLFMYYLLKSRGARILYLGANVPVKDVAHVIGLKKPDTVFIHLTGPSKDFDFENFLEQVHSGFGGVHTVISGMVPNDLKKLPPGVELKRSLSAVTEWLSSLS